MFLRRSAKIDRGSGEIQRLGRMEIWAGRETENERPKFFFVRQRDENKKTYRK